MRKAIEKVLTDFFEHIASELEYVQHSATVASRVGCPRRYNWSFNARAQPALHKKYWRNFTYSCYFLAEAPIGWISGG